VTRRLPVVLAAVAVVLAAATAITWTWSGDEAAPAAAPLDGATVFALKGCGTCHDRRSFVEAPDLDAVPAVAATREPGVSAKDYVRRSITSPDVFTVPGFPANGPGSMPALAVSAAEVDALVTYLLDVETV